MTGPARLPAPFGGNEGGAHDQARFLIVRTSRVVIWTTSDAESARAALNRRGARPRLLVPVPHGTFVLGPDPHTSETLIDNLRIVTGVRVGLMWTETTAWLLYFDGAVRGWRFGPDDFFEPETPRRLPDGLSWIPGAVEAVRAHGVLDGLGALRVALESAGFALDATALVKIDGGEVDDAVPHHGKKWWERFFGERSGLADVRPVHPAVTLPCALAAIAAAAFFLYRWGTPELVLVPLCVLGVVSILVATAQTAVVWSRGQRADPFAERDVLGMSAWARAADEE